MQQRSMIGTVAKWGLGIFAALILLFVGIVAVVVLVTATDEPTSNKGHDHNAHATESQPEPSQGKPEKSPESRKEPPPQTAQDVEASVIAYYEAAAAGDYAKTYSLLSESDQAYYSEDAWIEANTIGGSDQAAYELTDVRQVSKDLYDVDILVNGEPRTTQFVYDGGEWVHDLTADEVAMFDTNLASATATATASASAPSDSGGVEVRVEVSANKPVDVTILSAEDMDVPMISEEVQSETYTFTKKESADLTVDASDPSMDFSADANIHIEVYEDGELVAEDSDPVMALVQY